MNKSQEILSKIAVHLKYAKYKQEEKRRESWEEICNRYKSLMVDKYPHLKEEIERNLTYIENKEVLMSMRMAQFAGLAVEKNNARGYNCAYLPVDDIKAFSEAMFLLLGGTGVGYSVQFRHIHELPNIKKPKMSQRYLIGDSIEGWADAVRALIGAYFGAREAYPIFDYSDIRPKGAQLITAGGKAPGPEPLRTCLYRIDKLLSSKKQGEALTPIEAHDIMCHIADAVLSGGIRRAALISLFSLGDEQMMHAKTGKWYEDNPQRARSNNSVVLDRKTITEEQFKDIWKVIEDSGSGEPGVYFTNDPDWGTNPCCEIALRPFQFCNLTEINGGVCTSQAKFNKLARVATFFGTLQAGFTDFHYLRKIWQYNTERDSLIGVGITGICNGPILKLNQKEAARIVQEENERVAALIGINPAARTTTIKPSGTTSCVLGTSSGIHAWHSKFYIRNMQCAVNDQMYEFFKVNYPQLIKIMDWDVKSAVIGIPQKAPEGSILREEESSMSTLERVKSFNSDWVREGHRDGANTNNVSATISVRDGEWDIVGNWMWANHATFNGLSVLPFDNGVYPDAPFQSISKEEYENRMKYIPAEGIDLTKIIEEEDQTDLSGEIACQGGQCEITF